MNRLQKVEVRTDLETVTDGLKRVLKGRGWHDPQVSLRNGSLRIEAISTPEDRLAVHYAVDIVGGSLAMYREVYGRLSHLGLSQEEIESLHTVMVSSHPLV